MPQLTSRTNFGGGGEDLYGKATLQADALDGAGGGGGLDFNKLLNLLRKKKKADTPKVPKAPRVDPNAAIRERDRAEALAREAPYQQQRTASRLGMLMKPENNLSRLIGGPQAAHFQDYAARQAGNMAAGVPIYDYTGMRDIVMGNAGASEAAARSAGANALQDSTQRQSERLRLLAALERR